MEFRRVLFLSALDVGLVVVVVFNFISAVVHLAVTEEEQPVDGIRKSGDGVVVAQIVTVAAEHRIECRVVVGASSRMGHIPRRQQAIQIAPAPAATPPPPAPPTPPTPPRPPLPRPLPTGHPPPPPLHPPPPPPTPPHQPP